MITKADFIARIPRYKTGVKKGLVVNDRFKDILRMLNFYAYSEHELSLFVQEIDQYEAERLERLEAQRKWREAQKQKEKAGR